MGLFDGVLGQILGSGESRTLITGIASKVGLSPELAEVAITALAQAHPQPTDTVQTAAANTGLPTDVLQQIVEHLGGEGGLASLAGSLLAGGTSTQQGQG